jgi:4-oxalocrotonate tautomerase
VGTQAVAEFCDRRAHRSGEDKHMPFISVRLVGGRTHEQKQELARRITEATQEVLNTTSDHVWVTFEEIPGSDWHIAGRPLRPPEGGDG